MVWNWDRKHWNFENKRYSDVQNVGTNEIIDLEKRNAKPSMKNDKRMKSRA